MKEKMYLGGLIKWVLLSIRTNGFERKQSLDKQEPKPKFTK